MMSLPTAYFLTWTTYGTWLSGDDRGWVGNKDGAWHVPFKPANPSLRSAMVRAMKHKPVCFTGSMRSIVESSIRESCRIKKWVLHALAVQSNHVHIVLSAGDIPPERVMTHLKAYASRNLNTAFPVDGQRRWWTRHGSTRYIKTDNSLRKAVEYVERHR